MRKVISMFFGAFAFITLSWAGVARAESVVWNSDVIPEIRYDWYHLYNTIASVTYEAGAYQVDESGAIMAPLECGSQVPVGTQVAYLFRPHVYTDVTWFTTGYGSDSPYGNWSLTGSCGGSDYTFSTQRGRTVHNFFVVNPPTKEVEGLSSQTCTTQGSDKYCTLNTPGVVAADMIFRPTVGHWHAYESYKGCRTINLSGFSLPVPEQRVSCEITVGPRNETPTAPIVTPVPPVPPPPSNPPGSPAVAGGACIVGTPYSISMTSTDPRAESLRYGIDWDNNSTIDEFVPGSGYAPSGTTLTASRTYSTTGTKKIKVLAQNSKGMASGWTSITFSCAAAPEDATGEFSAIQSASGLDDNDVAATPDLALRLIPSIVKKGNSTKVIWSATNVKSCIVDALNGDRWTTVISTLGGEPSAPINVQTKYTLTCIDLADQTQTKTATVNILPVWRER